MPQSKDTEYWMDKKTWMRDMLPKGDPPQKKKTYTDWKWMTGKKYSKQTDRGKKGRVAILTSNKIDFKIKAIKRDTEGHFTILKGRIHQEDINVVNVYAPNIGAPKYMRKILDDLKKDIDTTQL